MCSDNARSRVPTHPLCEEGVEERASLSVEAHCSLISHAGSGFYPVAKHIGRSGWNKFCLATC
jgi:hypothetical protein